jgi:Glyoxalase-like domain
MLRLRQIVIVTHDLDAVVDALQSTLGLDVAFNDPSVANFGLQNAVLPLGEQFIEVVSPTRDGTAAGRYLDRRNGDGGYMVIMQTDQQAHSKQRAADLGVRVALQLDIAEFHLMQLHPGDTGGSFLEIDEQDGGEDLDGPWEPAGPEWQRARRVEVVTGIGAAEIQSPDPERLASRWGDILERRVEPRGPERTNEVYEIELDNATLRFVHATDGRGEGLGGIDLIATPAADLSRRVLPASIGGLRINAV